MASDILEMYNEICTNYTENLVRELASYRKLLSYNPDTGIFIWMHCPFRTDLIGKEAGRTNTKGHLQITINGKTHLAHHLAWLFMTGNWPEKQVDHKDTNKKNNCWVNLREATHGQNRANSKSSAVSGYKGVYKNRRGERWYSVIRVNKFLIRLGSFTNPEEAAEAYRQAAVKYHGEFSRT